MSNIQKKLDYLVSYLTDKDFRFLYDVDKNKYNDMSDEELVKRMYQCKMGKPLNLENPKSYTEKLQWLKLYDRQPIYTQMVDKVAAKKLIEERIGKQYVVPTIGEWDCFKNIDFNELPNKFILKCTHDSGSYCICRDKNTFDKKSARRKLTRSLNRNYYLTRREWPYKDVPHKIIAEELLEDISGQALVDYKYFCFNGEPKVMYIAADAAKVPTTDFFDMHYEHLPIRMRDPNAKVVPEKPAQFDEMKRIASILSEGIPHLRVDFYIVNNHLYVGEMTFFHMGGFAKIYPEEWDKKMGDWIILPNKDSRM